MSATDADLQKMVRGFRVSDLQSLLAYAGRNKAGKKHDLQFRALDLIKLHSPAIEMKIKEIHSSRYQLSRGTMEPQDNYPLTAISEPIASNYMNRYSQQVPVTAPGYSGYSMSSYERLRSYRISRQQVVPGSSMQPPVPRYPRYPDVRFKELPFYEVLAELHRPTSLTSLNERLNESEFMFCFTPAQLFELQSNPDVQVQLRMCALDTTAEQEDEIPPTICLKVNNMISSVPAVIPNNRPGAEVKRQKCPIDVTLLTKKTASEFNTVYMTWSSNSGKPYVLAIYLVRRLNANVLIRKLKANGVRNPDFTTAMIKEKLCQERDSEIEIKSLKGSLNCPLGRKRMSLPCRSINCSHIQCFDAILYLQMNEKKPKWICPVCDKPAEFKNLAIDGLFLNISVQASEECSEVQFHDDGSWAPVVPKKKSTPVTATIETPKAKKEIPKPIKRTVEVIDLDDSDGDESWPVPPKSNIYESDAMEPVLIDLPESNQNSMEAVMKMFNPLIPSTSASGVVGSSTDFRFSNVPESVDISSDGDCIIGSPPELILPTPTTFENVSPASSSDTVSYPLPSSSRECIENSEEGANKSPIHDLMYSFIHDTEEISYTAPVDDEPASPEVINID